jgi:uncharacterized protein YkwD
MRLTRMVVIALAGSLAIMSLPSAGASTESCWKSRSKEKSMAKKINKARSKNGEHKLGLDPELSLVARRNSRRMAKKEVLVHTSNLGGKVTHWKLLGENIGYGVSVNQLHSMFMNSEVHKDNILNEPFRHIGVGVVKKGDYLWVSVVFESKKDPGTTLNMPSC